MHPAQAPAPFIDQACLRRWQPEHPAQFPPQPPPFTRAERALALINPFHLRAALFAHRRRRAQRWSAAASKRCPQLVQRYSYKGILLFPPSEQELYAVPAQFIIHDYARSGKPIFVRSGRFSRAFYPFISRKGQMSRSHDCQSPRAYAKMESIVYERESVRA